LIRQLFRTEALLDFSEVEDLDAWLEYPGLENRLLAKVGFCQVVAILSASVLAFMQEV
jgi:hypothetical protein